MPAEGFETSGKTSCPGIKAVRLPMSSRTVFQTDHLLSAIYGRQIEDEVKITFTDGKEIECEPGLTVMEAIHRSGHVVLDSICAGKGLCGKCRIQVQEGEVTPVTQNELENLDKDHLAKGQRLGCECFPRGDLVIDAEGHSSFSTPYKIALPLQTEELDRHPNVIKVAMQLTQPSLEDPTPDLQRVLQGIKDEGFIVRKFSPHFLPWLPELLRGASWRVTAVIVDYMLSSIEPGDTSSNNYGIAFDLGTTTVAAYLLDMSNGRLIAQASETNRQVEFGADVLTRIDRAHEGDLYFLQQAALASLNSLVVELTRDTEILPANIYEAVIVGNTCMHHILLGIDPYQAGVSPFSPFLNNALDLRADDVGIQLGTGGNLYLLPLVSGFIGADTIADIIALDMDRETEPHLLIDIGTNAEMVLSTAETLYVCAAAAGPAFEGGRISCGMRAAPGAIDHVEIVDGKLHCRTIDNRPAMGITGSGMVSIASALKRHGLLKRRGGVKINKVPQSWLASDGRGIVLAAADETKLGMPLILTWRDIGEELVIAVAAIKAGYQILLKEAGLHLAELSKISVAGAFGNYLDFDEAIDIGLLPDFSRERFYGVGNAAGKGAVRALLSHRERKRAEECIEKVKYIELSIHPEFNTLFARSMQLSQ